MCLATTPRPTPAAATALAGKHCRRIDHIASEWHCAIIGSCLPLADLKAVAAKFAVRLDPGPSGYNLHASMVHLAGHDGRIAKALTRLLDRRHQSAVNRALKLSREDDLAQVWKQALNGGDVAGTLWAVMSHPAATEEIRKRVFQDVHMMSHQVGAAIHADLQTLARLAEERSNLETELRRNRERYRFDLARRDDQLCELRQKLDEAALDVRRLTGELVERGRETAATQRLKELEKQLALETQRTRDALHRLDEQTSQLTAARDSLERLHHQNADLAAELDLAEARIADLLEPAPCTGDCDAPCGRLDLCGRSILLVGGRDAHMPHLRRLVEGFNGTFTHHDGGVADSVSRLHGLFGRADAVLFPVDCVSHAAQDTIKRLCRRWQKPFVPVRRSGLASYLAALASLAAAAP
jgi:hypothetical protein